MALVCVIWLVGKEVMTVDCLKGCVVLNELPVINEGIGGKSEFPSDVVGENFAVDNSSWAVVDVPLLVVVSWPVEPIVFFCTLSKASEMLLDFDDVELKVVDRIEVLDFEDNVIAFDVKEVKLSAPFVVLVRSIEVVNEGCEFVAPVKDMKVNVDSLGIIELSSVCLLGWMVDDCKDMLPVVTSVIGTLFVDCIVDMLAVLDFEDDVSAFEVNEVELSAPFVVLVPSDEMFNEVWKVVVFVSCVVIGLESELAVEVFGKDVGEDCSEAVKDATLLAVIWSVKPIEVDCTLPMASENLLDIGNAEVVVKETSLIVRLVDGDVPVRPNGVVNEVGVFVAPVEDKQISAISSSIL